MIASLDGGSIELTNPDALTTKNFDGENLVKARLTGMRLEGASFCDSLLDGADLSGADCYAASFYRARLHGASMRMGVFKGVDFQLADLQNVDMRGADFECYPGTAATDFCHADLGGVLYEGAKFGGSTYDKGTIFPDGFDPVMHGMILVASR